MPGEALATVAPAPKPEASVAPTMGSRGERRLASARGRRPCDEQLLGDPGGQPAPPRGRGLGVPKSGVEDAEELPVRQERAHEPPQVAAVGGAPAPVGGGEAADQLLRASLLVRDGDAPADASDPEPPALKVSGLPVLLLIL